MTDSEKAIKDRLLAWKYEKKTNEYKLAYLADKTIKILREKLKTVKGV